MKMAKFKQFLSMSYYYSCYCQFLNVVVLAVLLLCTANPSVYGFNVDISSAVTHKGPEGSMFGFSVAQHMDSNVSWILVGAPTAESRQPGVSKAGAVFRCSCDNSDTCQQIPFDRQGNNVVEGKQIDEKSGQWFGSIVKSSGEDGIILACAPRYTWFSVNKKRRDPTGTCFIAKDSFTEFTEYSPCRTSKWGYHRQGSCQLGLGADVDSAGRRIFLGAVGSWYWQGQVFVIDSRKSTEGNRLPFYQFIPPAETQARQRSVDIRWTKEGPNWDDDSYLGYSVAHGEFSGDNDADVAVGMPRGGNLTGKVVIYSSDLTNLHNITGEQIGAYFGYAICVCDVDGDGLQDIIVGAPMFTDFDDSAMKIETGRVYVVYQTKAHKFKRFDIIDGTGHKGRFGLSLAALGDLNKDGFDDFAVGAPYAGVFGRGAVYIYSGSSTGVREEHTQVIYGESLPQTISTFGFSISGGRDLDGNSYPDIIVGAYDSDFVAYFRSKPVVRVKAKLSFTSTQNQQINLEDKSCTLRDGTKVTCLSISACMEYDGIGAEDSIDFNVQYSLDSKKPKDPRLYFVNYEGRNVLNQTVRLTKKASSCSSQQVYLRPGIRDKLTSLEAELKYSMVETRFPRRQLQPVIDVTTSTVERDSISIQKNCGPDNVCIPDLRLSVKASDKSFLMGSASRIFIESGVYNNGEDSFESMLFVQVPQGLSYVKMDRLDARKDVSVICSAPTPSTNNTLKCEIGNPLPTYAKVHFRLFFQPRYGSAFKSAYEFHISTNSTNPEENYATGDNLRLVSIPIRVQTDLKVFGASQPQPVRHNISHYKKIEKKNSEADIGPEVIHVYEIKCEGPSNIERAEVTILWPSYTLDKKHFLYLLEQPAVEGPAKCEHVDVNLLAYELKSKFKMGKRIEESLVVSRDNVNYDDNIFEPTIGVGNGNIYSENGRGFDEDDNEYERSSSSRSHAEVDGGYIRTYNYSYTRRTQQQQHRQSSSSYPPQYPSSSSQREFSRSSSSFDEYKDEAKRNRRAIDADLERELSCGLTECIKIRCYIENFVRNSSVLFWLRGRVYSETFQEKFGSNSVNISSKLIAKVSKLPYNVNPEYLKYRKFEILTTVESDPDLSVPSPIAWWIYLLAALAGLLLLLLIIYVLYKCGFFRRRRRPDGYGR